MDLNLTIAAFLISLAGVPHGALDPMIAYRVKLIQHPWSVAFFLAAYIGMAAAVIWFWVMMPRIALIGFLLISAFHFGRDWKKSLDFGGFGFGAFVLGLPAWTSTQSVEQIFSVLLLGSPTSEAIIVLKGLLAVGALLLALEMRQITLTQLFELIALTVFALLLSPLWYFTLYFCGLHSPRHLLSEFKLIPGSSRRTAFLLIITLTLLTIGFAIGFGTLLLGQSQGLTDTVIQLIFIGLAALTVPHIILLEWADRQNHEFY